LTGRATRTGAVLVIVTTGLVCAWPLAGQGGWRTYQDNPCHLATLADLARGEGGWSDAAFLGFRVTAIHSPLWYGALGRLVAWGAPSGLLLGLFNLAGFLAPALAVYAVASRRQPPWAAGLAGWLVLVQRPWLAGFESPLGGMAPFGLAAACLVLIVGELARETTSRPRLALLAALYGLLGLTHLFLVLPAVLAFALAAVLALRSPTERGRLLPRLGAAALGAVASAPYWLSAWLDRAQLVIRDQPLPPHLGLGYLVLPLDPLALAEGRLVWQTELAFTDVLPMLALVACGLGGLRAARRDPAARLGLLLAGALALLVLVVIPLAGQPLAGPHSWRRLFLVRLGLALAAAPALVAWPRLAAAAARRRVLVAAGVLLVASGVWWQRALREEVPPADSVEIAQLDDVWRWLRDHRPPDRGRLYVQDTFYLAGDDRELFHSHLPALTALETGWQQVGAWYGGMPLATEDWTGSQFGQICGRPLLDTDDLLRVGRLLPALAASRLVVANPVLADKMCATGLYREVYRRGRFRVVDPLAVGTWVETGPGVGATRAAEAPGRWTLELTCDQPPGRALPSLAWSPDWTAAPAGQVRLLRAPDGRLELAGIPAGRTALTLRSRPPRWPWWLAACGWLAIGFLGVTRST